MVCSTLFMLFKVLMPMNQLECVGNEPGTSLARVKFFLPPILYLDPFRAGKRSKLVARKVDQ